MRFGSEVDHGVDPKFTKHLFCGVKVADVTFDEFDRVHNRRKAPHGSCVGHRIEDDDVIIRVVFAPISGKR